jgi:hypothetical protein
MTLIDRVDKGRLVLCPHAPLVAAILLAVSGCTATIGSAALAPLFASVSTAFSGRSADAANLSAHPARANGDVALSRCNEAIAEWQTGRSSTFGLSSEEADQPEEKADPPPPQAVPSTNPNAETGAAPVGSGSNPVE